MSSGATKLTSKNDNAEQLGKLLEVARFMANEKDLDRLLKFIANQVTDALNCERCAIFLLDEPNQEIWSKIILGETKEVRFPAGRGIAGFCIESGEPVLIEDAYSDERFNKKVDMATGFRTRDILCVPLKNIKNRTIGCFQLVNKIGRGFNLEDQDFLTAFGSQAAVSIESAQYVEDLVEAKANIQSKMSQLQVFYDLEKASTRQLERHEFLQFALEKAVDAIGGTHGAICLIDSLKDKIIIQHACGQEAEKLNNKVFNLDASVYAEVIHNETTVVHNSLVDEEQIRKEFGDFALNSFVATPLFERRNEDQSQNVVGAVQIMNKEGDFDQNDQNFLNAITDKITSVMASRSLLDEKAKSDRLATIGKIADTIIHDFKNPMSIIKGMADVLVTKQLDEEKRKKFCESISGQVDRCMVMTMEILDYSKGFSNLMKKDIEVVPFLDEIISTLEIDCENRRIEIVKNFEFQGSLNIDRDRFKRVIYNLTNNAVDAMDSDGKLIIKTIETPSKVEIRIADTGPGIPVSFRKRLFTAFETQGKKDGTGLGLSIASEIVSAHKGELLLDETYQNGACFIIKLPKLSEN